MKELKTRENIYLSDYDVSVKPYLDAEELQAILHGALEIEEPVQRDMFIHIGVLQCCTDIKNVEDVEYNLLLHSGLIDAVIDKVKNYHMIGKYIAECTTPAIVMQNFLDDLMANIEKLEKKIPKGKKLEEMMAKIGELAK